MRRYRVLYLILISLLLFSQRGAIASSRSGPESLLDKYHEIATELEKNSGTGLFTVESFVNKNAARVDVYGAINYPFDSVQNELLVPTNWCQIVLPHPDVRACTYKKVNNAWLLDIYDADTVSEPLGDAYQMKFVYRISKVHPEYFDVALFSQEGPSHTKDHHFGLEAIPLDNNRTFIHLRYSFGYSALGYFLMKLFGGTRIGFSIVGTDSAGNPVYVEELRGAVERDVVCYYLAILAYLDTLKVSPDQQFKKRISQWYDFSARFKKQFFDVKKEEYIMYKNQDRENQVRLQGER